MRCCCRPSSLVGMPLDRRGCLRVVPRSCGVCILTVDLPQGADEWAEGGAEIVLANLATSRLYESLVRIHAVNDGMADVHERGELCVCDLSHHRFASQSRMI
jgi:hypothetical protein